MDVPGAEVRAGQVLGMSGELLVLIPVNLGVVALILLPFLDRNTPRSRRVIKVLATLALIS